MTEHAHNHHINCVLDVRKSCRVRPNLYAGVTLRTHLRGVRRRHTTRVCLCRQLLDALMEGRRGCHGWELLEVMPRCNPHRGLTALLRAWTQQPTTTGAPQ